jgi:hypothetical protein
MLNCHENTLRFGGNGGDIMFEANPLNLANLTFSKKLAGGNGGSLFSDYGADIPINNTTSG